MKGRINGGDPSDYMLGSHFVYSLEWVLGIDGQTKVPINQLTQQTLQKMLNENLALTKHFMTVASE